MFSEELIMYEMIFKQLILVISLINLNACFDCDSIPTTGVDRIKKDILCFTYDPNISPKTIGTEATELSVMVIMKAVGLFHDSDRFGLKADINLTWHDDKLKWNPNGFENIMDISEQSSKLWLPDLGLIPNHIKEDDIAVGDNCKQSTNCTILFNGQVTCLFNCRSITVCRLDLQEWPYDSQHCEIDWSIASRPQENIVFKQGNHIELGPLFENENTYHLNSVICGIKNKTIRHPTRHITSLEMKFKFDRTSKQTVARIIYPGFVMVILNLFVFLFCCKSNVRLIIGISNLFLHSDLLHVLKYEHYEPRLVPPNIVYCTRNSMIIAAFSLIFTVMMRRLIKTGSKMHYILQRTTNIYQKTILGQICIPGQLIDVEDPVAKEKLLDQIQWKNFAKLLDFILFWLVLIAYIITFIDYFPRRASNIPPAIGNGEIGIMLLYDGADSSSFKVEKLL